MTIDLKGKVVLITGASSGFGMDAARLFAEEGCNVVLAARRIDRLQELAASIQARGGEAFAVPVDVAAREEVEVMVETVLDLYERVDILFNNAGFGRIIWNDNMTAERDIETQLKVNLLGLIYVTHAILPSMLERRSGHIINMSSVAGWIAPPTYTIYSASKYGVRGFTDALRREARPFGVNVSGIYPGPAKTEFGQHTGDHPMKKSALRRYFRSMTSEQVAERVVEIAKRPRRAVVMPWYYNLAIWADWYMPWFVDWITESALTKKRHKYK
ncbi:MAG: SDR family NAD(P)-dependent oxidoreductase [Anaerolineae bacterium CFX3]|nr:SDR family NAD(P)-dependent oxidoreductase [Anaerolineae bacterium]MCE7906156.1 SDR family NAD(P)-dependent oxidoreductase [Anaerolineae bacterium CFX3]MCQ3947277.1 oxidoreductase [Anaerolineae bacterium]RIK26255.1 MAG: oxidoreductase [Anaerolineae bacterium]